jgi:F0F1-type ATP synthase assembly protein I
MAEPRKHEKPDDRLGKLGERETEQWYKLATVGIEFAVAVVLLGLLGWWLDQKLGTLPWLTLAGAAVGFATGLWLMIKAAFGSFR